MNLKSTERQSAEARIQADPVGYESALPIQYSGSEPDEEPMTMLDVGKALGIAAIFAVIVTALGAVIFYAP